MSGRTVAMLAAAAAILGALAGALWMLWELANPDRGKNAI